MLNVLKLAAIIALELKMINASRFTVVNAFNGDEIRWMIRSMRLQSC